MTRFLFLRRAATFCTVSWRREMAEKLNAFLLPFWIQLRLVGWAWWPTLKYPSGFPEPCIMTTHNLICPKKFLQWQVFKLHGVFLHVCVCVHTCVLITIGHEYVLIRETNKQTNKDYCVFLNSAIWEVLRMTSLPNDHIQDGLVRWVVMVKGALGAHPSASVKHRACVFMVLICNGAGSDVTPGNVSPKTANGHAQYRPKAKEHFTVCNLVVKVPIHKGHKHTFLQCPELCFRNLHYSTLSNNL